MLLKNAPFLSHMGSTFQHDIGSDSCSMTQFKCNKLCGRPPQYAPAPCKLTSDLFTLNVVSESRDVGYLCANFSLPRPLCSRLRPDVCNRDRQTSDAHHQLMPPTLGAGRNKTYDGTYMNAQQSFLAVMEELVQFPWCRQCLCSSINQLQKVSPCLVDSILPFSNCRCVWVTSCDQLIADVIDGSNALLTNHLCVMCKLLESVAQHLQTSLQWYRSRKVISVSVSETGWAHLACYPCRRCKNGGADIAITLSWRVCGCRCVC